MAEKRINRVPSARIKETSVLDTGRATKSVRNFAKDFLDSCEERGANPLPILYIVDPSNSSRVLASRSVFRASSSPSPSSMSLSTAGSSESIGSDSNAPRVFVVCENSRKPGNLQRLYCRGGEITLGVLDALAATIRRYDSLAVLGLQNCGINACGVARIAELLAEVGCVRDLNLDGNPDSAENCHRLCSPIGKLRYLSLRMCRISDECTRRIADELKYREPPYVPILVGLNLANNDITDAGAAHIRDAIRTNRSLQSIVLAGNKIGDDGAASIIESLITMTLTHEEVVAVRRWRLARVDSLRRVTSSERQAVGDSQTVIVAGNNNRSSSSLARRRPSRSGKKSSGTRQDVSIAEKLPEDSSASLLSCGNVSDVATEPKLHPFYSESRPFNGDLIVNGNFELQHLNLSFNKLTEKSLEKILSCIEYQRSVAPEDPSTGLLYVRLEGNNFDERNNENWIRINELLNGRQGRDKRVAAGSKVSDDIATAESKTRASSKRDDVLIGR